MSRLPHKILPGIREDPSRAGVFPETSPHRDLNEHIALGRQHRNICIHPLTTLELDLSISRYFVARYMLCVIILITGSPGQPCPVHHQEALVRDGRSYTTLDRSPCQQGDGSHLNPRLHQKRGQHPCREPMHKPLRVKRSSPYAGMA